MQIQFLVHAELLQLLQILSALSLSYIYELVKFLPKFER